MADRRASTSPQDRLSIRGRNELKVGNRTIRFSSETGKRNPNSLRFVLGHIVNFYFDGSRERAAEEISTKRRYVGERSDRKYKSMNAEALSGILKDAAYVEYWHIEGISKTLGLPSGALLALSRLYALLRDENDEAARAFVQGIHEFADCLGRLIEEPTISKEALDAMIKCFESTYRLEHPVLWDK